MLYTVYWPPTQLIKLTEIFQYTVTKNLMKSDYEKNLNNKQDKYFDKEGELVKN